MQVSLKEIKKFFPKKVFLRLEPVYHFSLAFLAAVFYGFPSRRLKVIGVTGTKGKTSTVELIHAILEEGGFKTASLSSLRFKVGDKEEKNTTKMTMPGRFFIQNFLHEAVKAGCTHVVLEVTSQGIKQFRHRFIRFDTAVMTNLAPEHLESHGGLERYLRAKLDLFWRLKPEATAIVNRDDVLAARFLAATRAKKGLYGKGGIEINGKLFPVKEVEITQKGIGFEVGDMEFHSSMLGEFNFYNILAAVSVGLREHISLEKIKEGIKKISGISGRLEFIQKEPFAVVVDYAHTPDSLRSVYGFLRDLNPKSYSLDPRLICVLGAAGGGRDKWKRPEMGRIAVEFCSEIILTNEDPYDEDPIAIINDIFAGIPKEHQAKAKSYTDRREAIYESLKLAEVGDAVVITGKGAENCIMGSGGEKIPWDDREVAREELKKQK